MCRKQKGFTMMELVSVLAVMGVLAVIATPFSITYMSHKRLNGAAWLIMSDMMWARMAAVSQRNAFRFFFVNDHVYQILDDDNNDGKADDMEWVKTTDISTHYPDVLVGSNANPMFFPRGSASMGTVVLKNRAGVKKIKVHITGRIKVG